MRLYTDEWKAARKAEAECERLRAENRRLTAALALSERQLANATAEITRLRPTANVWAGRYPDPKER